MLQRLKDLYSHVSVHATADREHQAAVELLLLVMTSDKRISDGELDEIRTISEESGWETDTFSVDQYFGEAMAKVRSARSEGRLDALLDSIDERFSNGVLRAALFAAARDVAGVDHQMAPAERAMLEEIAVRFG